MAGKDSFYILSIALVIVHFCSGAGNTNFSWIVILIFLNPFRYKDRKEIHSGQHYRITQEDDVTCSLTIMESFPEDSGAYMCQLRSDAGMASSEALLNVIRK